MQHFRSLAKGDESSSLTKFNDSAFTHCIQDEYFTATVILEE